MFRLYIMQGKCLLVQTETLTKFRLTRYSASKAANPASQFAAHYENTKKKNDLACPVPLNTHCSMPSLKLPTQVLQWVPSPVIGVNWNQMCSQYKKLSKFRLTSLVVITTMGGYAMAPAAFDLTMFTMCSLGTGLMSAAANAINQYHEVPFDSQMSRTKNRVIVTGQLTPMHAVGFAVATATAGLCILYFGVNSLTAFLGAGNFFLYTLIYTPLKRMSILNTWVGSIVGALPPLMGWSGCTGSLDYGSLILGGLLYAWQFPHFNALSWNLRQDYSRAGYCMMAVTNPGLCRRTAFRYSIAICGLSVLAPILDVTNYWFILESLPLNLYFIYLGLIPKKYFEALCSDETFLTNLLNLTHKFNEKSDSSSSRKLFRFSLLHLPALMFLFLMNKKRWSLNEPFEENIFVQKEKNFMVQLPKVPSSGFGTVLPVTTAAGPR